jgi:hypothetical protein
MLVGASCQADAYRTSAGVIPLGNVGIGAFSSAVGPHEAPFGMSVVGTAAGLERRDPAVRPQPAARGTA